MSSLGLGSELELKIRLAFKTAFRFRNVDSPIKTVEGYGRTFFQQPHPNPKFHPLTFSLLLNITLNLTLNFKVGVAW